MYVLMLLAIFAALHGAKRTPRSAKDVAKRMLTDAAQPLAKLPLPPAKKVVPVAAATVAPGQPVKKQPVGGMNPMMGMMMMMGNRGAEIAPIEKRELVEQEGFENMAHANHFRDEGGDGFEEDDGFSGTTKTTAWKTLDDLDGIDGVADDFTDEDFALQDDEQEADQVDEGQDLGGAPGPQGPRGTTVDQLIYDLKDDEDDYFNDEELPFDDDAEQEVALPVAPVAPIAPVAPVRVVTKPTVPLQQTVVSEKPLPSKSKKPQPKGVVQNSSAQNNKSMQPRQPQVVQAPNVLPVAVVQQQKDVDKKVAIKKPLSKEALAKKRAKARINRLKNAARKRAAKASGKATGARKVKRKKLKKLVAKKAQQKNAEAKKQAAGTVEPVASSGAKVSAP
jgi:hypothetical protein